MLLLPLILLAAFYIYPVLIGGVIKIINEVQNHSSASSYSVESVFRKGQESWKRVLKILLLIFLVSFLVMLIFGWIPLVSSIVSMLLATFINLVIVRGVLVQESSFSDLMKEIINLVKSKTAHFLKLVLVQAVVLMAASLVMGLIVALFFMTGDFFSPFGGHINGSAFGLRSVGAVNSWQGLGFIGLVSLILIVFLQSFLAVTFLDLSVWWLTKMSGIKSEQMEKEESQSQEEFAAVSGANQSPEPTFSEASEAKKEETETQEKLPQKGNSRLLGLKIL